MARPGDLSIHAYATIAGLSDALVRFADQMDDIASRLARIERRQIALARALGQISDEQLTHDLMEEHLMSDLTTVVTDLEARVTEMVDVEESAAAALNGLGAEVATLTQELADAGVDPALVARLEALGTVITDEDGKLAAAIAANTPAAPEPAPEG